MFAKVLTAAPIGFDGSVVEVESDATKGLPGIQIVGLGNKAIDEAKSESKAPYQIPYLNIQLSASLLISRPPSFQKMARTTTFRLP